MADMQGHATDRELTDLYFNLSLKIPEERKQDKFSLFVPSKGMLDGQEAYIYLKARLNGGN